MVRIAALLDEVRKDFFREKSLNIGKVNAPVADPCELCPEPSAFSTPGLCVSCYEQVEEQPHPETKEGREQS